MIAHTDPRTLYAGEEITCRCAIAGRVISFASRVRHVDTRGLYVDTPSGLHDALQPGGELLVRYLRRDSAYQFLTLILAPQEPELEEAATLPKIQDALLLRFPAKITRFQRRAYDRSRVEGVVKYRLPEGDIRIWRGYILDLSAGGVRFATRQAGFLEEGRNPIGVRVLISLLLPKGYEIEDVPSEIRRMTLDHDHVDDDYLIVQAAFRELEPKVRERLDTWVRKI